MVTIFLRIKYHKFLKFICNNYFFSKSGWYCDYPKYNEVLPLCSSRESFVLYLDHPIIIVSQLLAMLMGALCILDFVAIDFVFNYIPIFNPKREEKKREKENRQNML